jgi:hypothetical protein
VVPFPLETISAADGVVVVIVVDVAVGFPNNLKKLNDGSIVVGLDLHGSTLI